jgi:hypothetical protein
MVFFGFWAFNTAGKTVTKVGIYSQPPLKSGQKVIFYEIYRFLMISTHGSDKIIDSMVQENNSRPNFNARPFLLK